MKVIVIGNGKVGKSLVEQLFEEGHDVTVIDKKLERLEVLNNTSDVLCIQGDGININTLIEAGVETSDFVISTTSSDELNIVSGLLAKSRGAKHTVARIRSKEYSDQAKFIKKDLSIDYVINPELQTAKDIANQFRFVGDFKVESLSSRGLVDIISFKLEKSFKIVGLTLSQINTQYGIKMLVCAVQRKDRAIIPSGDFLLCENDIIYIMASYKEINTIIRLFDIKDKQVDSVFIVGASKLSYYLSKELLKMNLSVKIMDHNLEACENMAEQLPEATIIHADAGNQQILEEEGAFNSGAFISLTGNDEMNIILSLCAKAKNTKKIITKVNQFGFMELVKTLGLNNIFSPREVITNHIISYFRSIKRGEGSAISVHRLVSNQVEAVEYLIDDNFSYINIPLKDLNLQKDILIAGVIRKNEFIRANGNTTLNKNDVVIILSLKKKITKLEDIIKR